MDFYTIERPKPWRSFGISLALQAVGVLFLLAVPLLFPSAVDLRWRRYAVTSLVSITPEKPSLPPPPPPVIKKFEAPRIVTPKIEVAVKTPAPVFVAPVVPKPKLIAAPELKIDKQKLELASTTAIPKLAPQVKTNVFETGSTATPTLAKPIEKVQTGGFSDGVKADPTHPMVNVARAGGFEMPAGPGQGNGSAGAQGARGAVASAGFGAGVAQPKAKLQQASLSSTGFGEAQAAPTVKKAAAVVGKETPLEILSKLNPVYTPQARAEKIEGEVVLEAAFSAFGQVKVLRVVKGLGYGLDEAAIRAAEKIRYKPAQRDGEPYDTVATLHVVFQMAY